MDASPPRCPRTTELSVLRYNSNIIIGINSTTVNVIYNCRSFMNGISVLVLSIMVTIPEFNTHMSATKHIQYPQEKGAFFKSCGRISPMFRGMLEVIRLFGSFLSLWEKDWFCLKRHSSSSGMKKGRKDIF
jgi:hypothetical protein